MMRPIPGWAGVKRHQKLSLLFPTLFRTRRVPFSRLTSMSWARISTPFDPVNDCQFSSALEAAETETKQRIRIIVQYSGSSISVVVLTVSFIDRDVNRIRPDLVQELHNGFTSLRPTRFQFILSAP